MKKLIKFFGIYLFITLFISALIYGLFSFLSWDINPGNWSYEKRLVCSVMVFILVWAATFLKLLLLKINKNHDKKSAIFLINAFLLFMFANSLFFYGLTAFAAWDANPGNWTVDTRIFICFYSFIFSLAHMGIFLEFLQSEQSDFNKSNKQLEG
jgi:membrane protein implicated in regulation of membrane protease activity